MSDDAASRAVAESIGMGWDGLPGRPMLRPGVFWCRRGDDLLQIGLLAGHAVIAPDTESVRRALAGLRVGEPSRPDRDESVERLWRDLMEADLLVPAADLATLLHSAASSTQRDFMLALVASEGARAPMMWSARSAHRVLVTHDHLPRAADRVRALLADAGVTVVDDPRSDLEVHLAHGEVDRGRSDAWLQADRAHLVLTTTEGRIRVGPFVVPGRTACLRCLDAHEAVADPRRPLVLQQYAVSSPREVDHPAPVAPDLLDLALIWIARDVVAWCEGHTPRTWGATVDVTPRLELPRRAWSAHVECGCGWGLTTAPERSA